MAAGDHGHRGAADPDRFLMLGGGMVVAIGGALGVVRYVGRSPAENGPEGILASVAFAAVLAAPGVLALLARADRPGLLVPAASLLVPLSLVSMAGVTLPLLIPAVLLAVAYARRAAVRPPAPVPVGVAAAVVASLVLAAVAALLVHQDPRHYATATMSGWTSDVVTAGESLVSLALVAAALGAGWWLTGPRREGRRVGRYPPGPARSTSS